MLRYEAGEGPEGGSYEFIHDRFREVVLDSITPSRRKSLHLRIAGVLEDLPGSGADPDLIAALANHYQMAAEQEAAAGYFFRLGEVSMDRHAPDEAAVAFQSAIDLRLQLQAGSIELASLELSLGMALFHSGKRGAAEAFSRAGEAFLQQGQLHHAGMALDQLGLALAADEQHEAALATYHRALDLISAGASESRYRALVLLHMSDTLGPSLARYDEALRAQRQAMSLLDPGEDDERLRSVASLALGRTLTRMNRLADAQEVLERALPPTIRLGELSIAADLEGARANVTYWRGDVRQSRSCTLQRLAYAQSAGDLLNKRHISSWLAHLEVALGNWAEAERLLDEAERDVSGFDSPEPLAFTQQIRGHLAHVRGDYAAACELMLVSLDAFRQMGTATVLWYIAYAARASHAAGKSETSAELASEAWLLLDELPANALPKGATLTSLALLAIESGRHEHCRSMYEALLPFAGQLQWTLVDRSLGMLATAMGRAALACRHFEQAIVTARRYGLRPEYALAEAARSRVTGENLDQSVARLRSIGVSEVETRAGRAEPSIRPPNPANLTDREVEVLRLVAAGMTNREIAGSLNIAEKTVTNHITHIFDKANLENRAAAAAFAVRHHLA
jgi:DNA-binding CsgD family transcriptional regulator/predicted ATPase